MDEVVVFRPLGRSQVRRIADLELAKTAACLAERGVAGLEVGTALMARIVAEGYNEAMGARELRRAITRLVDDALSDALLNNKVRWAADVDVTCGAASSAWACLRQQWQGCGAGLVCGAYREQRAVLSTAAAGMRGSVRRLCSCAPCCLSLTPASCLPAPLPACLVQLRAGDTALLDSDAEGRTVVMRRGEANNIVNANIVYSSVAA
jgi:hypothetical protein